jgi:hypothetical protein
MAIRQAVSVLSLIVLLFGCAALERKAWQAEVKRICSPERLQLPPEARKVKRHWFMDEGVPPGIAEEVLRANYECGALLRDRIEQLERDQCAFDCKAGYFSSGFLAGIIAGFVL